MYLSVVLPQPSLDPHAQSTKSIQPIAIDWPLTSFPVERQPSIAARKPLLRSLNRISRVRGSSTWLSKLLDQWINYSINRPWLMDGYGLVDTVNRPPPPHPSIHTHVTHLLRRRPLIPPRVPRRPRARLLLAPHQVVPHALAQVHPPVALQAPGGEGRGDAATAGEGVCGWLNGDIGAGEDV